MIQDFSNRTILIIDDDAAFRKFIKILLEKGFNCRVDEADNPKKGFEYFEKKIPDAIILDMQMPIMDGHTALTYIRSNEATKSIPVIACTALSYQQLFLSLVKLQISDYIVKPSSGKVIRDKIQKLLASLPQKKNLASQGDNNASE